MKAAVLNKYGSPDNFELLEVEKPTSKDHEVLVRIHASSVNSWDGDTLLGIPFANRLQHGLFNPKSSILGCDIAGRIVSVGKKVKQLRAGDEDFGDISGAGFGGCTVSIVAKEKVDELDIAFDKSVTKMRTKMDEFIVELEKRLEDFRKTEKEEEELV